MRRWNSSAAIPAASGCRSSSSTGDGTSQRAGASSQSERTLTVTIKYSPDQRVDTFSYHSSRF